MRKQMVETKTRYMARKLCPWAAKIVKCEGGYWCFESVKDYETWKHQK